MSLSWNWKQTRWQNDRRRFNSGLKRFETRLRDKAKESVNSSFSIERRRLATRSLPYQKNDGRSLSDANTTVVTVMVLEFRGQHSPALKGGLFGFIEPTPSRGYEEQTPLESSRSSVTTGL